MVILINVTDVKAEGVYRPPLRVYDHFYGFDAMRHYLCRGYVTDSPGHASEAQCVISLRVSIKDGTGRSFEHDLATQLVHPLPPYISLLSYIFSFSTCSACVLINTIEARAELSEEKFGRNKVLLSATKRLLTWELQFGIYSSFWLSKSYLCPVPLIWLRPPSSPLSGLRRRASAPILGVSLFTAHGAGTSPPAFTGFPSGGRFKNHLCFEI